MVILPLSSQLTLLGKPFVLIIHTISSLWGRTDGVRKGTLGGTAETPSNDMPPK